MNKLKLIKNQEMFQGEKYLNKSKNYFEGWYFKNTTCNNKSIAFIPGISICDKVKTAFIQVIVNDSSYYISYDIKEFEFSYYPFYIKIKDSFFSNECIKIDIQDKNQNIKIKGEVNYLNSNNISSNIFSPNIMGIFSYVPFMECNHAIISMKNTTNGMININDKEIFNLNEGVGYIEKDWGYSFPKKYIWCQANDFKSKEASFMLSIANVPFKIFEFQGIIASFILYGKEYKFTTYNNAKLIKCIISKNEIDIQLKKGKYYLYIQSYLVNKNKLSAPVNGKMEKDIFESVSSIIKLTLKKNNKIIFSEYSSNCGLEIVK